MAQVFPYTVIRSNRKTIALEITGDGKLVVRCSYGTTAQYIEAFVRDKAKWIEKHLAARASAPLSPFTQAEIKEFANTVKALLPPRLEHYAKVLGVSYNRVTIRSQHSRWGSCSRHKSGAYNLNFNCLLALVPPEVLDYVVVHELCHIRQMNHSKDFWALVETVLPDYAARRKWLRQQGGELISRLPE